MKRKADNDDYILSEPKPKRCRKKRGRNPCKQEIKREPREGSISDSFNSTGRKIAHPDVVAELKTMSRALVRKRHGQRIKLDVLRRDVQFLKYKFKLKAYLRMPVTGRWACPVSFCTQSYTRKSHMKSHITNSSEVEHEMPRDVFLRTLCHFCGDEACDNLIIQFLENQELFPAFMEFLELLQSNQAKESEAVEGRKEKLQAPTPAIGSNVQDDHEMETTAQDKHGKMTPESRQQARISKIVEDLSKSTQSDTEEGSKSGHEIDTPESTDMLHKGSDHIEKRCSISFPSPRSEASIEDHGSSFSSIAVPDEDSVLGDYVIVKKSDGENEDNSYSPAVQSRDRYGADAQHHSITNLDFYDPKSAELMQRTHFASKAPHIPGSYTQVPPHSHSVSSGSMLYLDDGLGLSHHYQPNFDARRQGDRIDANGFSSLDWEPMSYSGYGSSAHHHHWASARTSPFATQSLGLAYDGTTQGYPYGNIEDPLYSSRLMRPDRTQPLFYQLSSQALAMGPEYCGTNPYQASHQQTPNFFNDSLINHANHPEQQQTDPWEQEPGWSEFDIEQDPSFDGRLAAKHDRGYSCKSILVNRPKTVI